MLNLETEDLPFEAERNVVMEKIYTLDTTLRDGMQSEKIFFTVKDKIKIVKYLDLLGIDYIEAGNPSSNPKDEEFFHEIKKLNLKHSEIVAFGSTRKPDIEPEKDENLKKLASLGVKTVSIFGKAWLFHVKEVLKTTAEENLNMIKSSVEYLKKQGLNVIFDAEHFFDGYRDNSEYAVKVLQTAAQAGAEFVVLCDTNGGGSPLEFYTIVKKVKEKVKAPIGIHTHNDSGMAVSSSVISVQAGATQVQGTINGIGERCGNANLATIIANLQLKDGYELIPQENLKRLTEIARGIADISNISISSMPYVSQTAFSHKAGMHIDGVIKSPHSFEHVNPADVGNKRSFLVSEMSGKSAILPALNQVLPGVDKNSPETDIVLKRLKELEFEGYQFEAAHASLDIAIRKALGMYKPFFTLKKFKVMVEQGEEKEKGYATAVVKVEVDGKEEITAADSDGPVHAMDTALRKALYVFYPSLMDAQLIDYKVRVLNSDAATGATTRVLIETTDGEDSWITVGVSTDILEASRQALIDSIDYKLLKRFNDK